MNTRKLYSQFHNNLQNLSHWQLTALATASSERAWPNYALFCELTGYGEVKEVRHCLDMLWDNVAGLQSAKNFERLLERLDNNTPSLEAFDIFGVQPALDFAVSLHCGIHCAMKSSVDEAASALTLSLSTVGKFIKYTEVPELKGTELTQYIEAHELFQVQMGFLDLLMSTVTGQKKQNRDFARELQQIASNEGVSHLGISLE